MEERDNIAKENPFIKMEKAFENKREELKNAQNEEATSENTTTDESQETKQD